MNEKPVETLTDWLQRLGVGSFDREAVESESCEAIESAQDQQNQAQADTLLMTVARPAMACEFEVLLNQHQYPNATDTAFAALEHIEELENLLSVYKPKSEFSLLNRFGAQRSVGVSYETSQLISLALAAHSWTGGAFDITAGSLSEAWGFSRRKGRKPTEEQITEALARVGSQHIELNIHEGWARVARNGVQLNPGGIGKGYALDRAAQRIWQSGIEDFMVHGGLSSILAVGDRHNSSTGGGWRVSLKHPMRWEEHLGTVRLRDQALGTSGSGKQFFHFGGRRFSHIIDPRTGWPASELMSASVVCPSAAVADILATSFFVLGREASREFCEEYPQVGVVLVYQEPKSGSQIIEPVNLDEDTWLG